MACTHLNVLVFLTNHSSLHVMLTLSLLFMKITTYNMNIQAKKTECCHNLWLVSFFIFSSIIGLCSLKYTFFWSAPNRTILWSGPCSGSGPDFLLIQFYYLPLLPEVHFFLVRSKPTILWSGPCLGSGPDLLQLQFNLLTEVYFFLVRSEADHFVERTRFFATSVQFAP